MRNDHHHSALLLGENKGKKDQAWLTTFTDLIMLMLTFFVMLVAMGEPKKDAWEQAVKGLKDHLGKAGYEQVDQQVIQKVITKVRNLDTESGHDLGYLQSLLENQLRREGVLGNVLTRNMGDRIIVSLPSHLIFQKGDASLSEKGQDVLNVLVAKLDAIQNRLEIYGHTDPDPTSPDDYASNWELSLARSAEVAHFLGQHGYKRDIIAQGFAHGRYDDLPSDIGTEQRKALSRRIDLVIQQDKSRE